MLFVHGDNGISLSSLCAEMEFMPLAVDFDSDTIGTDFRTTDMDATAGGEHVALVANAEGMIVYNNEPVTG